MVFMWFCSMMCQMTHKTMAREAQGDAGRPAFPPPGPEEAFAMLSRWIAPLTLAWSLLAPAGCADSGQTHDNRAFDQGAADASPRVCDATALLPGDNAVGDFVREGAVKVAVTAKQLQDLIDGGSDKYEKNHFKCMSLVRYRSASRTHRVEVWVFNQTDAAGARAAYEATRDPDDVALSPPLGDAARENKKLLFEYTADLRKGAHLVRVKIDQKQGAPDGPRFLKAVAQAMQ